MNLTIQTALAMLGNRPMDPRDRAVIQRARDIITESENVVNTMIAASGPHDSGLPVERARKLIKAIQGDY